jgi:hypothetical protein
VLHGVSAGFRCISRFIFRSHACALPPAPGRWASPRFRPEPAACAAAESCLPGLGGTLGAAHALQCRIPGYIATSMPEKSGGCSGCKGLIVLGKMERDREGYREGRQRNPPCLTLLPDMTDQGEADMCSIAGLFLLTDETGCGYQEGFKGQWAARAQKTGLKGLSPGHARSGSFPPLTRPMRPIPSGFPSHH